ncbi:MAG: hypothetical protein KGK07_14480 [Chloroflexota bacterium]|nr:hypothetical protein [Chloroflexota bacterium]
MVIAIAPFAAAMSLDPAEVARVAEEIEAAGARAAVRNGMGRAPRRFAASLRVMAAPAAWPGGFNSGAIAVLTADGIRVTLPTRVVLAMARGWGAREDGAAQAFRVERVASDLSERDFLALRNIGTKLARLAAAAVAQAHAERIGSE